MKPVFTRPLFQGAEKRYGVLAFLGPSDVDWARELLATGEVRTREEAYELLATLNRDNQFSYTEH